MSQAGGTSSERRDRSALQRSLEAEVDEELNAHLECLRDELRTSGLPENEIYTETNARFGDLHLIRRACLTQRRGTQPMKQQIVTIILTVLVLSTAGLALAQRQARVVAMEEIDSLRVQLDTTLSRLEAGSAPQQAVILTALVGDQVVVVAMNETLSGTFEVGLGGEILLPDIGRVHVAGLTSEEIELLLRNVAERYFAEVDLHTQLRRPRGMDGVLFSNF